MWISFASLFWFTFLIFHFITSSHSSSIFFEMWSTKYNRSIIPLKFQRKKFHHQTTTKIIKLHSFILSAHKQPKSSQLKHSYTIKCYLNIFSCCCCCFSSPKPKHPSEPQVNENCWKILFSVAPTIVCIRLFALY